MATQVQRRRGTTTQHATFTGAEGELTVDTTKDTVVVHDGTTAGGRPLAREDLDNVTSGTVTGKVDAASTSAAGKVQLNDSTTSTSTTTAATANSVKVTKDVADAALPKAGGTMTGQILGDDSTSAATPGYAFDGDPNSGIYSPGADQLGFSTGGTGRMFIDASGNIGVGTSSPGYNLTVQGVTASINVKDPDDNTSPRVGRYIFSFSDGDGASINATRVAAGAASNVYLSFRTAGITNAEERLRIASDGFISLGGDTDTGFSNPAANNLAFSTGGSERARIDSSGRLLVGTSTARSFDLAASTVVSPYLQIEGQNFSSSSIGLCYNAANASGSAIYLGKSRGASAGANDLVSANDTLGYVIFEGADGAKLVEAAYVYAQVDGTPGADDMPGRLVLSTTSDGSSTPTERMRINSSGQVLIGKTAGSYTSTDTQFEVAGGIQSNIGIGNYPYWSLGPVESITIVNGGSGYTDGTYTAIPLLTNGIAEGVAANFTVSGGVITAVTVAQEGRPETNRAGDALTLQTSTALGAGGTGLSLTTASVRTAYFGAYYTPGRIRLGNNDSTISANQELGSILFSQRDASSVGGILYGGAGDTARIYARAVNTLGGGYFDFWTAANGGQAQSTMWLNYDATNSILRIRNPGDSNSGFVSVLRAEQATATTARNGGQIVFGRENANSWAASTTDCDGYIAFSPVLDNTNTERMRITSAGFVGIGTSSPAGALNVQGSTAAPALTYDTANIANFDAGTIQLALGIHDAAPFGAYLQGRDTGNSSRVISLNPAGGNVGIGTTAPQATTHIQTTSQFSSTAGNTSAGLLISQSGGTPADGAYGTAITLSKINSTRPGGAIASVQTSADDDQLGLAFLIHPSTTTNDTLAEALRISHAGTATFTAQSSNAPFIANIGASEVARIDSSGRLLVGTSTGSGNTRLAQKIGVVAVGTDSGGIRLTQYMNNVTSAPLIDLRKSRGSTDGTYTVVNSGDALGYIVWGGADGTDGESQAAAIQCNVDGTPGTADMPGRLVFSTTADGASAPTEQFRITNDGVRGYNQAAPVAVNTTATLTVANLKNGIITSTTAAAVVGTLPTGTLTEGGFSGLYTNFTFEWTVINTGATNSFTVQAGTDHTVVGNMVVAAGNSGRFATRRTAANTFVTYRLSS